MSETGDESNVENSRPISWSLYNEFRCIKFNKKCKSFSPESLKGLCRFVDGVKRTVKIETSTVEIEERGVKLRLTVVDTPGYGDGMDNKDRLEFFLSILTLTIFLLLLFTSYYQRKCLSKEKDAQIKT